MALTRRASLYGALGGIGLSFMHAERVLAGDALAGRGIRFLLPTENGADSYARPFSDRLRLIFPGATITVQNETAAGGKLAAKMLAQNAGGDITIAMLNSGLLLSQLLGEEGVDYDFRKFRWIGSMTDDRRVLLVAKHVGVSTLEDMRGKRLTLGVNTMASSSSYDARMLNAILGLNLHIVPGFRTSERLKGIIAGELDAICGSYAGLHPVVDSGDAKVVLRYTSANLPGSSMNAPLLGDLIKTGTPKSIANFLEMQSRNGRSIAASPATSDGDLALLRDAFDRITADPQFRTEMEKVDTPVDAETGTKVEASMETLFGQTQKISQEIAAAVACGLEVSDGTRATCDF
jgi:tripartite-type tricarboxylate transporter receptor subunit TctC